MKTIAEIKKELNTHLVLSRMPRDQHEAMRNALLYINQLEEDVENLLSMLRDAERANAKEVAKNLLEFCPEMGHARWEYGVTLNHEWRKCSKCLVSQDICGCFTYCPNCGAKMDGGAEE